MKKILVATLVFVSSVSLFPQKAITLSVGAGYGTASKIIPYPRVSDFDLREAEVPLGSYLFPRIEIGYAVSGDLTAALSLEYASKRSEYYGQTVDSENGTIFIPVKDGYTFMPVELTLNYTLPFSSEWFQIFIGGGGGLYFFSTQREVAGLTPGSGASKTGYGIHVSSGFDWYFSDTFGMSFSMKFRDPEVEFEGDYASREGNYNGKKVTLGTTDFNQKLSLEGTVFILALKARF